MLQVFLEIFIAVLAVYGGYTALHELGDLICRLIQPRPENIGGKEDLPDGGEKGTDHLRGDD